LEEGEADTLCASGKAEYRKTGRREVVVLLDNRTVRDFRSGSSDSAPGGPALQSTYAETHRGKRIAMQKRTAETMLHKWDVFLTFAELRAGYLVSQATREKRAEAEHRKKNIVAFLAYEEYQREREAA